MVIHIFLYIGKKICIVRNFNGDFIDFNYSYMYMSRGHNLFSLHDVLVHSMFCMFSSSEISPLNAKYRLDTTHDIMSAYLSGKRYNRVQVKSLSELIMLL